jgi:hypothetical protein
MKILPLILLVTLAAASILVSMGMDNSDKDAINATTVHALEKTGNFSYIKAEVDMKNNLSVWATSKSTDKNITTNDAGYIIGVYIGQAKNYPDLSDLNIQIGTKDKVVETMYCKRSWVDEVKTNSAGNMSDSDLILLTLRVLDTHQMKA